MDQLVRFVETSGNGKEYFHDIGFRKWPTLTYQRLQASVRFGHNDVDRTRIVIGTRGMYWDHVGQIQITNELRNFQLAPSAIVQRGQSLNCNFLTAPIDANEDLSK